MRRFFFLLLISAMILAGCGQGGKQAKGEQQEASGQKQEYEKVSDKLKKMETDIEQIFFLLEGPSVGAAEQSKKGGQGQGSQSSQSQSTQGQGTQEQGTQGQGAKTQGSTAQTQSTQGQGGQGGQQGGAQAQLKEPWKDIDGIISNLHYEWTDYIPDAVKKGASGSIIDDFGDALNNLTSTVSGRDRTKVMAAANTLSLRMSDLFSLYKSKLSSEAKRTRYYIRSIVLNAYVENWAQVTTDVEKLKHSWTLFKSTLGKEQQEDSDKLDFSIYELDKVVKEKNKGLADIKGRVAVSSLEALEKSIEKEE